LAVAAAILIPAVTFLGFTKVGSYTSTAWNKVKESVNSQVPVEFEIDRIKQEVSRLDADIIQARRKFANDQTAYDRLDQNHRDATKSYEEKLPNAKDLLQKHKSGEQVFIVNNRTWNREQIAQQIESDSVYLQTFALKLKQEEEQLKLKLRGVQADQEVLNTMQAKKLELTNEVARIELEWNQVKMAQTENNYHYDDTRFGEIKKSLADLHDRINSDRLVNDMEKKDGPIASPAQKLNVRSEGEISAEARDFLEGKTVVDKK
jgi:hypothetical protein